MNWPVPPPFMWSCSTCVLLLVRMVLLAESEGDSIRPECDLSRHVVEDHPEEVPPPHYGDCIVCPEYALYDDPVAVSRLWAEHRVRELFMPPEVARLL
ncbi:hypothetical protein [Streptomyces sp. NPDC047046]|uniref:hypothetical protein n=1 Tax=Streptomyces sp. NPDC047046 TaxID=3155378 RepID=UPI0033D0333D